MQLKNLGYAIVLNNLRLEVPQTVEDVKAVSCALETVGFTVMCYNDCNTQVRIHQQWKSKILQNSFADDTVTNVFAKGHLKDIYQQVV